MGQVDSVLCTCSAIGLTLASCPLLCCPLLLLQKERKESKKGKKDKKHRKKDKKRDKKDRKDDASEASAGEEADDPAVKAEPMDTE